MALVLDGPVTPDAQTAYVREVPTPANHALEQVLPDRTIPSIEVDFDELNLDNDVAPFRAWDSRIPFAGRNAPTRRSAKLPPLSIRGLTGELERIQLQLAETGGSNRTAQIRAIYDDSARLTRRIRNRMEAARGSVLFGTTAGGINSVGTLTVNENGLVLAADFGVPGNHKVTAATPWSTVGSATAIADMTSWVDVYTATNGHAPGGFYTSTTGLRYMLQNSELRTLAASLAGTPARVGRREMDDTLSNFGLPPFLGVYDTVVKINGVDTRVSPADRLMFVPPTISDLGFTAWGITATALELVNSSAVDFSFADAPGIVGVIEKDGPPYREETFVDAAGMPILANPKKLFVAKIY